MNKLKEIKVIRENLNRYVSSGMIRDIFNNGVGGYDSEAIQPQEMDNIILDGEEYEVVAYWYLGTIKIRYLKSVSSGKKIKINDLTSNQKEQLRKQLTILGNKTETTNKLKEIKSIRENLSKYLVAGAKIDELYPTKKPVKKKPIDPRWEKFPPQGQQMIINALNWAIQEGYITTEESHKIFNADYADYDESMKYLDMYQKAGHNF